MVTQPGREPRSPTLPLVHNSFSSSFVKKPKALFSAEVFHFLLELNREVIDASVKIKDSFLTS